MTGSLYSVLVELLGSTFAFGATAAAGLAGFAWLYRNILRPAREAAGEVREAVPALKRLPEWMDDVDEWRGQVNERLDVGSEQFRELSQRIALAERAATSVARDSARTAENTQALVRDLEVPVREP